MSEWGENSAINLRGSGSHVYLPLARELIPQANSPNSSVALSAHLTEAVFSKGRSTEEFVSFALAFIPPSLATETATTRTMTVTATASGSAASAVLPPICSLACQRILIT